MDLYGEWAVPCRAILFLRLQKAPDVQICSGAPLATIAVPDKIEQEISLRGEEKINTVSKKIDFCKNDYNLAKNINFWARPNCNSFANFGPLMTNDGALESSHQGENIFPV